MENTAQFNVVDHAGRLLCPACGFPSFSGDPTYDERGGLIGTAICPCCTWEPGFDDNRQASAAAQPTILDSLRAYREKLGDPPRWQGRAEEIPAGWNGGEQLQQLFAVAPHLR